MAVNASDLKADEMRKLVASGKNKTRSRLPFVSVYLADLSNVFCLIFTDVVSFYFILFLHNPLLCLVRFPCTAAMM